MLDLGENAAIRQALSAADACPEAWARWKWGCVFAALLCTAPMYVRNRDSLAAWLLGWAAALAAGIAGLVGLTGVVLDYPSLIESGSQRLATAIILGIVYLAAHHWLRDGLLRALHRLAQTRVGARLTAWPSDPDPAGLDQRSESGDL